MRVATDEDLAAWRAYMMRHDILVHWPASGMVRVLDPLIFGGQAYRHGMVMYFKGEPVFIPG